MTEGKKIRLKDGFSALAALVKHSFGPRSSKASRLPAPAADAASREAATTEKPA